jgi:hypothetical protein
LAPGDSGIVYVNAAANGFFTEGFPLSLSQTFIGANTLTGQVQFPATQSASSDPNTLDDYEEGTFTAAATPGVSGSITLDANTCRYTKFGDVVTVTGALSVASVSSPIGNLSITGLPFTASLSSAASVMCSGLTGLTNEHTQGNVVAASTTTQIFTILNGVTSSLADNVQAGTIIRFSATYHI